MLYEPTLSNTPSNDRARTTDSALVATDAAAASALLSQPDFTATSNGFRGVNDGWTDLRDNGRMDWRFTSAGPGHVVQTGRTPLTCRSGQQHLTLSLGFATNSGAALANAKASARRGFGSAAQGYAAGWRAYLRQLKRPPGSVRTAHQRTEYVVSEMVLAASEDKINRGAYVASPTMPWAWGPRTQPVHTTWFGRATCTRSRPP